jgi:hypothetical protein
MHKSKKTAPARRCRIDVTVGIWSVAKREFGWPERSTGVLLLKTASGQRWSLIDISQCTFLPPSQYPLC